MLGIMSTHDGRHVVTGAEDAFYPISVLEEPSKVDVILLESPKLDSGEFSGSSKFVDDRPFRTMYRS